MKSQKNDWYNPFTSQILCFTLPLILTVWWCVYIVHWLDHIMAKFFARLRKNNNLLFCFSQEFQLEAAFTGSSSCFIFSAIFDSISNIFAKFVEDSPNFLSLTFFRLSSMVPNDELIFVFWWHKTFDSHCSLSSMYSAVSDRQCQMGRITLGLWLI